jgi:hypothetical protein
MAPADHRRWNELFERDQALHEESERRATVAEGHERAVEGSERAQALVKRAAEGSERLGQVVEYGNDRLKDGEKEITDYIGYYTAAYDTFTTVLKKAKADAESRANFLNAISGIVIGTGLGLAGGAIFEGAEGLAAVIVEAAGEGAEYKVGKLMDFSSKADFEPPKGVDAGIKASEQWQQLAQAWKGLALLNTAMLGFGEYRVQLERVAGGLGAFATGGSAPRSLDDLAGEVHQMEQKDVVGRFLTRLDETWHGLIAFSRALHHPVLQRLEYEIEQDLWIQWISQLRGSGPQVNKWGMPVPVYMDERVQDALDEDAVENHLERIGLIGEKSRLGVDFGWNTTRGDTEEAFESATREQKRNEQLGRLGVAITPIREHHEGVVHMRHGAYEHAAEPEPDPDPSAPEGYFKAEPSLSPVAKGEVVRVTATVGGKLLVRPVEKTGWSIPIDAEEEKLAASAL